MMTYSNFAYADINDGYIRTGARIYDFRSLNWVDEETREIDVPILIMPI
jgi:hypothetical protein